MSDFQYTYTFIIPHHNSPDLLNRCIGSIPQREDIQIIVVDDNSAPGKNANVQRNGVKTIVIDAKHTKGAGHARNIGLSEAKGKWVLFADCDDYYIEGFIDVLDKYSNSDLEVLYFNFEYRDGVSGEILTGLRNDQLFANYQPNNENISQIKYFYTSPWMKMVCKDFIEKHNIYFEESPNGNDMYYSILVASLSKKIAIEPNKLYMYVRTPNSIVTTQFQSVDGLYCRLIHTIKKNSILEYYNLSYLKRPIYKPLFQPLKQKRFYVWSKLIWKVISNISEVIKARTVWVYDVQSRINKIDTAK